MAEGYDYFLTQATKSLGEVSEQEGGSGYFSAPDTHLDPRLFVDDDTFDPHVRAWLLKTLYGYWRQIYRVPEKWSTVWLAGSGISYQWAADRSNGDLDVLIGVDFPEFYRRNPDYQGLSEVEMADVFNRALKADLWTQTDQIDFGVLHGGAPTGVFEVTYYVNPNSTDIRDIKPYAAYNLTDDSWTVRPPKLPASPESLYPREWWDAVGRERTMATTLVMRYNAINNGLSAQQPGSPGWFNNVHDLGLVVDQAHALFDDIHLGRRQAFAEGGEGYGDYHNFRWQAHKRYGTVQALNKIARSSTTARTAFETQVYGSPLVGATQALTGASLWGKKVRVSETGSWLNDRHTDGGHG